jgi:2-dehydro-3-deoxygluconokinase
MNQILCFGELLLRFSPLPDNKSFEEQQMPVFVGGAELNVAQALAQWGMPVAYCTALPDNFLTASILQFISRSGINTAPVQRCGDRMGIHYLAQGKDVKHEGVVFDRAGSAFAALQPGQVDWKTIMKNKSWFHFSAIAASLSESAAAVCLEAVKAAREAGLAVSVDLNYRSKLWKYGKQPVEVMPELVKHCDLVMGNLWAVEQSLGIPSPIDTSEGRTEMELVAAAQASMSSLQQQYPATHMVAYTFRLDENYFAVLSIDEDTCQSRSYPAKDAVDRVGSGDCFMAGLIYSIIHRESPQNIIDFAASAAVGKLYERGDSTQQAVAQVMARMVQLPRIL